jgi:hypothetical protein
MAEFEEDTQGEDGSNSLDECQMNKEELQADLQECNNQLLEGAQQQCPNMQCNDLPPGLLKQSVYVPQTPPVAPIGWNQCYNKFCSL